jgi:hypothetical protein
MNGSLSRILQMIFLVPRATEQASLVTARHTPCPVEKDKPSATPLKRETNPRHSNVYKI